MTNNLIDLNALETLSRRISENYVKKDDLEGKISSVYKPGGSRASLDSSLLVKDNVGRVYNMTQAFQTNASDFVEGANKTYPEGTNVVVIETDSGVYKFDVLSGFVDLSEYPKTSEIPSIVTTTITNEIASMESVNKMLDEVFT